MSSSNIVLLFSVLICKLNFLFIFLLYFSARMTLALIEPLLPIFYLLLQTRKAEEKEIGEEKFDPDELPSIHLETIGIKWKSVIYTIMERVAEFDVVNVPCVTTMNTKDMCLLLQLRVPLVDAVVFKELARRCRVQLPGRPLGSVYGHDYEGSVSCTLDPIATEESSMGMRGSSSWTSERGEDERSSLSIERHEFINPLAVAAAKGGGEEEEEKEAASGRKQILRMKSDGGEGTSVKFLVLHSDVLRLYPQRWRPYRGGSNVKGAQQARQHVTEEIMNEAEQQQQQQQQHVSKDLFSSVFATTCQVRAETTISLEGCTLVRLRFFVLFVFFLLFFFFFLLLSLFSLTA